MRDGIPIGEENTVFGLGAMVGVTIGVFVRKAGTTGCKVHYAATEWRATRVEKFAILAKTKSIGGVSWEVVEPDKNHTWLTEGLREEFTTFIPLGLRSSERGTGEFIFKTFGNGVKTNRDDWVYSFDAVSLGHRMHETTEVYNSELQKWQARTRKSVRLDDFVLYDDRKLKWSRDLKQDLERGIKGNFSEAKVRHALYRPFTRSHLYFDRLFNEEVYQFPEYFPNPAAEQRQPRNPSNGLRSETLCCVSH
jgi:predicted helicase